MTDRVSVPSCFTKAALFPACGVTTRKVKKPSRKYPLTQKPVSTAEPAARFVRKTRWAAIILYIDRSKCDLCFLCLDVCPSGALDSVGKAMSINDIMNKILPDKPFFDTSGGGVTLSGGEPTLFMDFTSGLLKSLKQNNIHTLFGNLRFL